MKKHFILIGVLLSSIAIHAQTIDFDMAGRQSSEVTADSYSSWMVAQQGSDTKTFDDISITVAASGNATVLRSQWSKNDVKSANLKLTGDGMAAFIGDDSDNTPNVTDKSVGVTFTISGLTAGKHTVQAYHNGVNGYKNLAPIDVYVNGEKIIDDLAQTENCQTLDGAALSYVSFTAEEGKDVVITYTSDPKSGNTYGSSLIYVNALVFDQVNTLTQAQCTYPTNGDYHADADNGSLNISWTAAKNAVMHHLYIGTTEDNLTEVASQTATSYNLSDLSNLNTYYWRIDEEDASGVITEGTVWTFRPRHLAFPGAEGYGKYAIGGRGGSVYHVTTLEDNGDDTNPIEGSFRYGIKKVSGPRTIVFDVAGIISLKNRLTCSDPYVTIAGQTAPGNGILLRTCPFGMATDGITRFVRMRLGHKKLVNGIIPGSNNGESYGTEAGTSEETTVNGVDGMGMAGNNNSIMDHCSISWTIDEAFSSRNAQSVTLQRTLISEALNQAGHPNYSSGTQHGYAATIGGGEMNKKVTTVGSYHHNLLANCEGRNWSLSGGLDGAGAYDGHHDVFCNVVYNWGGRATDGGSHEINFVNNFYKMGEGTTQSKLLRLQLEGTGTGTQSAYVNGNIRQEKNNGSLTNDALGTTYQYETSNGQTVDWTPFVSSPFFPSLATIESAKAAYKNTLCDVGANEPFFDVHDKRMVNETLTGKYSVTGSRSGKKGLPDSEEDAGCEGFDGLGMITTSRDADWDSDNDGMPNWWEEATGLNVNAADNNDDADNDGYTNLEEYLNWMAEPHFTLSSESQQIDLRNYFAGYNNNPSFIIEGNEGSIDASIDDNILVVSALNVTPSLSSLTIQATDDDGWGSFSRTINFYNNLTNGISDISTEESSKDAIMYNIAGQRVGNSYKGIAIINGKKIIK